MRSGDLLGDLGQRRVTGAGVFEPVLRHRDGVGPAMPFADKTRTRLQAETRCGADATCGSQCFRQRPQLATRRLAEPAVFNFLKPVANPEDQQVAADPRRITVVQAPPFAPQLVKARLGLDELRH